MSFVTVLMAAFGLAMDAFAVSVTSGISIKRDIIKSAFKFGAFFGFFQVIMPLGGWLAGVTVRSFIAHIDHWIAFGLLFLIGCRMIYESFKTKEKEKTSSYGLKIMLLLSIATSIDALAAGLSFAFLETAIMMPVIAIGTVTFILSFFGVLIGSKAGHFFERRLEAFGGVILIAIGIKILAEHLLR